MSAANKTRPTASAAARDEIVTFWEITRKQYSKNKPAMVAFWLVVGLVLAAVVAPLITMNAPYVMKSDDGLEFPLFDHMFNRLIFKSGVDVFFNLLLILAPVLWFGARAIRFSGIEGPRHRGRFLGNVILAGLCALFLLVLAFQARSIYIWLLLVAALGLGILFVQGWLSRRLQPRQVLALRNRTRLLIIGLFLVTFWLALTAWVYTAPVIIYRQKLAQVEEAGGWALSPPIFYHPDNKGEDGKITSERFLKPPSIERRNILGTDNNGRDVFSQLLFGARISLTIGVIAVSIYATIGTILGSLAGYFGGRVDMLIIFLLQIMMCIPGLFLILTIVAVFENRSIFLVMFAIAVVSWTGIARVVRGEFMRQRNIDYVMAARACGIPERRIIFGHILKNSMSPVLVSAAFGVGAAILAESFISFIGLGDVNAPSWGQLLKEGRDKRKDWLIWAPGMAIFFVVTILNMVGDGLRDALDPKLRQ